MALALVMATAIDVPGGGERARVGHPVPVRGPSVERSEPPAMLAVSASGSAAGFASQAEEPRHVAPRLAIRAAGGGVSPPFAVPGVAAGARPGVRPQRPAAADRHERVRKHLLRHRPGALAAASGRFGRPATVVGRLDGRDGRDLTPLAVRAAAGRGRDRPRGVGGAVHPRRPRRTDPPADRRRGDPWTMAERRRERDTAVAWIDTTAAGRGRAERGVRGARVGAPGASHTRASVRGAAGHAVDEVALAPAAAA